eukprot:Plantae.Rhodophyta-Purpureofilum_apyrenoidigerum.ctg12645.p1 GENE.Plantae.Rhodophyta-Purpureofilum_apyrenoidigerum.ctg12645~~Plantae.Rhodophyta-Purpureofilum_apyrenoidigerum.ctg12645.p1  ORF type:complete len:404 (-),score=68.91 Plantae.Rhodophyta-Purpureofilum_apyrenoidigerum.ctg12645:996-2207(-)
MATQTAQKSFRPTGLEGIDSLTLSRFVLQMQQRHKEATGDLTILMNALQISCKVVETCVRRAGIAKLYGLAGIDNFQSDSDKSLKELANDTFKTNIEACEKVAIMVSEVEKMAVVLERRMNTAKYAIAFDPLDGVSNVGANISVGSIFAIYRIKEPEKIRTVEDASRAILQRGRDIAAAGYAMYGSATNLVISTGEGVHGFTLDPSLGEFVLTHQNVRVKSRGNLYSVNEGNSDEWNEPTTNYIESIKFPPPGKKPYSLRYIGTMVADIHRTLFYGGIFMYPSDHESPKGKLRLMYEVFPMAFLIEQAGGLATTGTRPILDICPTEVHQRVPVYMGSREDVLDIIRFFDEYPVSDAEEPGDPGHTEVGSISGVESLSLDGSELQTSTPTQTPTPTPIRLRDRS